MVAQKTHDMIMQDKVQALSGMSARCNMIVAVWSMDRGCCDSHEGHDGSDGNDDEVCDYWR